MKAVFVGSDLQTEQTVGLSLRLRWPDAVSIMAASAGEGLELAEQESPDVIILHPSFTDMSLSEAIEELRRFSNVPLLVLGRQGDPAEAVTALVQGADDYIRPPHNMIELSIRIWALLRRAGTISSYNSDRPLKIGGLFINLATHEVFLEGIPIHLTNSELRILSFLAKNRNMVVTHQALDRVLWKDESLESQMVIKNYIQRLRQKLGDDPDAPIWIATVRGVGYRFIGSSSVSRPQLAEVAS